MSLAGVALALAALGGCASDAQSRLGAAAATPLNDLNVVREEIPPVLADAQKDPYAMPADLGCPALVAQIRKLDGALGPDLDTPATESNPGLIERGTDTIEDTAFGAFQRTAEGIIPFRGWIRKITGAEAHAKRVAAAVAAGVVRRAYLKGLGASHGCTWTTSPAPASAPTSTPVSKPS